MSLIFIGEYMLLNLFIAVLLGGFSGEDEDKAQKMEDLDSKTIKKNLIEKLQSKDGQDLIEFYEEEQEHGKTKVRSSGPSHKKKRKKKRVQNGNILDESFDYEKDAHEIKKLLSTKKKKDFEGIYCEYSMYIFSKQNKVRVFLYRAVSSQNFEWIILGFIVASSIMLVIETYMNGLSPNDPRVKATQVFDLFFTAAFAFESFIKSISFGFVQDRGSYLRDSWSKLDFFIVVTSLIDASFSSVNIPVIKILRMLRTLRPLRFISRNSGMKALVTALLGSAAGFFNILIVVLAVWLIFAILAVNFFGGKMYSCTINGFMVQTETECIMQHGQWQNNIFNYDSVPNAIFTLFCISTKENWNNYMYNAINAPNDPGGGPSFQNNEVYGYFFVVYMMIGTYLFKNLFIGYIFGEFESAIEEEKAGTQLKDE